MVPRIVLSVALLPCLLNPSRAADAVLPAVTVSMAAAGTLAETVLVTGTLAAREEVLVSPQIDGLAITEIDAEEGDKVGAGQVLARLSHDALDASNLAQNAAQHRPGGRGRGAGAEQPSRKRGRPARSGGRGASPAREGFGGHVRHHLPRNVSTRGSRRPRSLRRPAVRSRSERAGTRQQADAALMPARNGRSWTCKLARTIIRAPVAGLVSRRTARLGAVDQHERGPAIPPDRRTASVELEGAVPETRLARLHPGSARHDSPAGRHHAGPAHVRLVAPEVNAGDPAGPGAHRGGRRRQAGRDRLASPAPPWRWRGCPAWSLPLSAVLFDADGAHAQAVVQNGTVQTRQRSRSALRSGGQSAGHVTGMQRRARQGGRRSPAASSAPGTGSPPCRRRAAEPMSPQHLRRIHPAPHARPLVLFTVLLVLGVLSVPQSIPITRAPNVDVPIIAVLGDGGGRRPGRAGNPGHPQGRGRGRRRIRGEARHLLRHGRGVVHPRSRCGWRSAPTAR